MTMVRPQALGLWDKEARKHWGLVQGPSAELGRQGNRPPWRSQAQPHLPYLVHTGDEYRPLLLGQETTAQILIQALNPLDYRKWRTQSMPSRLLKVAKVR